MAGRSPAPFYGVNAIDEARPAAGRASWRCKRISGGSFRSQKSDVRSQRQAALFLAGKEMRKRSVMVLATFFISAIGSMSYVVSMNRYGE
jgi:hypothetical protein